MEQQQQAIDRNNADFWDEFCGSALARDLGIVEISKESLDRFDYAYFEFYPCLQQYVFRESLEGAKVLEIGGKAIVMLYNRHSFRQLVHVKWIQFREWLKGRVGKRDLETHIRAVKTQEN